MDDAEKPLDSCTTKAKASDEKGAGLFEYVLIAALISIIAVVSMLLIGRTISRQFSSVRHEGFQ